MVSQTHTPILKPTSILVTCAFMPTQCYGCIQTGQSIHVHGSSTVYVNFFPLPLLANQCVLVECTSRGGLPPTSSKQQVDGPQTPSIVMCERPLSFSRHCSLAARHCNHPLAINFFWILFSPSISLLQPSSRAIFLNLTMLLLSDCYVSFPPSPFCLLLLLDFSPSLIQSPSNISSQQLIHIQIPPSPPFFQFGSLAMLVSQNIFLIRVPLSQWLGELLDPPISLPPHTCLTTGVD